MLPVFAYFQGSGIKTNTNQMDMSAWADFCCNALADPNIDRAENLTRAERKISLETITAGIKVVRASANAAEGAREL